MWVILNSRCLAKHAEADADILWPGIGGFPRRTWLGRADVIQGLLSRPGKEAERDVLVVPMLHQASPEVRTQWPPGVSFGFI